ncbi:MAG: hypothetical protein AB7T49_08260 [Oligoflexales bacterium]
MKIFAKNLERLVLFVASCVAITHCSDDSATKIVRIPSEVISHPLMSRPLAGISVDEAIYKTAESLHADSRLTFSEHGNGLGLTGSEIKTYDIELDSIPFCDFALKGYQTSSKKIYLVGKIPDIGGHEVEIAYLSNDQISDLIQNQNNEKNVQIESSEECLILTDDMKVRNVLRVSWTGLGRLSVSLADNERIYSTIDQSFDINGTAKIFPNNIYDNGKKSFPLTDLTTANKLASSHFEVVVSSPHADAVGTNNVFDFDVDTSEFEQTSAFTNATRTVEWFESIGYINFGSDAIQILVHADQVNNAFYTPKTSKAPTISIGDWDGIILQNLATDADVVGHEFGHHIVYQTVRTVEKDSEALVLHEGLADFFTFARTGNACLGESICPESSHICSMPAQCLRTGDNSYRYGDDDLPVDAHLRSQFISAMLWDMKNEDEIGNEMAKYVLKAIDLLVTDSGYRHLVLALLTVDEDKYDSANCDKILARAKLRGLTSYLSDVSCGDELPIIDSTTAATTTTTTAAKSASSKKKFCAVQDSVPTPLGSFAIFLFMLVPPMFVAFRAKRPALVPARAKRTRKR